MNRLMELVPAGSAAAIVLLALLGVRKALFSYVARRCREGKSHIDATVVAMFRTPSILWCFILSALTGVELAPLPERYGQPLLAFIHVMLLFSITIAAANVAVAIIRNSLARTGSAALQSGIIYGVATAAVYAVGGITILSRLGIAIAPLLTAFGVAGLAVALAFKDTLENTFSGIYLLLDQAVTVGDHITLEGGQKGKIHDIGWRTARIEADTGDLIVVPNVKLAQGIVIRRKRG